MTILKLDKVLLRYLVIWRNSVLYVEIFYWFGESRELLIIVLYFIRIVGLVKHENW